MSSNGPIVGNTRSGRDRRGIRSAIDAGKSLRHVSPFVYKGISYELHFSDSSRGPVAAILAPNGTSIGTVSCKSSDFQIGRAERRAIQGRIIRFCKKHPMAMPPEAPNTGQ